jgi:ATP-dependent DNA helicase RecG
MINIKKSKATCALLKIQKKNFITNLLQEMRREGIIKSRGTTRWANWFLSKTPSDSQI